MNGNDKNKRNADEPQASKQVDEKSENETNTKQKEEKKGRTKHYPSFTNTENHKPINTKERCNGCKKQFYDLYSHKKNSLTCKNNLNLDKAMRQCRSQTNEQEEPNNGNFEMERKQQHTDIPKPEGPGKPVLSCLDSNSWLNDEVINQYLKLVNELDKSAFMFTSFFHTAFREGGFKRVKSYYRKSELLEYRELYIPVHKENHWILITYNGTELVAYDPFNYPQSSLKERKRLLDQNKKRLLNILSQLEMKYFKPIFVLKKKLFKGLSLHVKVPPEIPAQNNSWDCGVFLTTFVKYLILKKTFNFDCESMNSIRKTMKMELQNGQLTMTNSDQEQIFMTL